MMEIRETRNLRTGKKSELLIKSKYLKEGLIKQIGAKEFTVLLVILSFSNLKGESVVSQRKIAECTGFSLPTVNKVVNNLLKVRINNNPLIQRKLINNGERKTHSLYMIGNELT